MDSPSLNSPNNLPYSADAERAVLGAILVDSDTLTIVEGLLQAEQFFVDSHQKIYECILKLSSEGDSVDVLTVAEALRGADGDQKTLGPQYLVQLTEDCPVTQNVEHYAKIVRKLFFKRNIIQTCQNVINQASSYEGEVESFIETVEKEFLSISQTYDRKGLVQADDVLESTIDDLQRKLESDGSLSGVPTGFHELDNLSGGLQGSDLIILAARPGMGKTALVLNMASNAMFAGKNVAIFTLEMSKEQLMGRVLAAVSRVDSSRLRKGDLSDEEQDRLMEGARRIYERKEGFAIDETPGISLMELRSRCRRYHKEVGIDFIVVDYLQLMTAGTGKPESRERDF